MKRKTIEQIIAELEDSLTSEVRFTDYITGDEFEAWLKDLKKDSELYSEKDLLSLFDDFLGFSENDLLIPVNSIIESIKDCGYVISDNKPYRGMNNTHQMLFVYTPTGQHVYNIWLNVTKSKDEAYIDAIYSFRISDYFFKSGRMGDL